MGHERLGALPRTKKWQEVLEQIDGYIVGDVSANELARTTLDKVKSRIKHIQRDAGVRAVMQYLVGFALSMGQKQPLRSPVWELPLPEDPSAIQLGLCIRAWVERNQGGGEHAELAVQAATDAFSDWTRHNVDLQEHLFEDSSDSYSPFRELRDGAGFSELSHSFFTNFIRRYLKYFLEREASGTIGILANRERLDHEINRHASETAKITQSFSAGWFNKHVDESRLDRKQVNDFLSYAFSKIKEELVREDRDI